jgi:hypothetical protein
LGGHGGTGGGWGWPASGSGEGPGAGGSAVVEEALLDGAGGDGEEATWWAR